MLAVLKKPVTRLWATRGEKLVTRMRFHVLLLALACCDARPLIRQIRDQREFDKVRDRRAAGKSLDG